jgi:CspA family cold shock protein
MNGVIKKLTDRGFGFIGAEGQEKDLFFHSKSLEGVMFDELREGEAVSFDIENGEKGPAAVRVKRA